jgi:hypothetical protein
MIEARLWARRQGRDVANANPVVARSGGLV